MTRQSKVVVITGASAGVGRAVARAFAKQGARVALLARGTERLEDAAREVRELGGEAIMLPTDVADAAQVEAAATAAEGVFGPIDVWVNNAMATVMARTWDVTAEEFRRVTEVNYLGTVYGTQAALKRMRARDDGVIVQVGSALAYRGIPVQGPYCASKHAIVGFTESLRAELLAEDSAVHVTLVHLPAVNTPQFLWSRNKMDNKPQPVPPIFQPEVAADAIVWASEHRRREILVGMPTLKTVWGNRVGPGVADLYLARKGISSQLTDEPKDEDHADNLFGEDAVLDDVSLRIEPGEIFALLGPNGAGKTTLIRCVTGLLLDFEGRIEVAGYDVRQDFRVTRQLVGLVPQEIVTDDFFTVREVLRFQGGYFGAWPSEERIDELLGSVVLLDKKHALPRSLSGGMKRRLMICKALVHDPVLLFLDEPSAGVDVELREELWEQVRALRRRGTTVVLTTHYLEEAEALADRIGILHCGQLLRVESQAALRAELGTRRVRLKLDRAPSAELTARLAREGVAVQGKSVTVDDLRPVAPRAGSGETALLTLPPCPCASPEREAP
jgi:ABC-type multidrug transport system ATPase subunit/NAD(P)-dependent dehydrogenase (short-subunit alcohol dehydrogenase family)